MAQDDVWSDDDFAAIDNFEFSPESSPVQPRVVAQDDVLSDDDFAAIDNFEFSPESSPVQPRVVATSQVQMGFPDGMSATLVSMEFPFELVAKAIEEKGPNAEMDVIIDTIEKYRSNSEAGSSRTKIIDHFTEMGFNEEKVIRAINEYGDENMEEIAEALLSSMEVEKPAEEEPEFEWTDSDDEKDLNNSPEESLVNMGFSEEDASLAVKRCGVNVDIAELADFICAARMAREFQEFYTGPEEKKPRHAVKKRRIEREPRTSPDDEPVRLPNPMVGFGLPNEAGLITERSLSQIARRPPFFYYENVAQAPKGVWDTISRHLFDIEPEFMDSKYICAAARKRGYVHNLPIKNRSTLQPPPKYTINEAFPLTKRWWPTWDSRTKLNCILTCIASAKLTNRIRRAVEPYSDGREPPAHVKKYIIDQCRRWNLVWVGQNKTAPLEAEEMENLLGFPKNHTRGGGMSRTDRYKALGNSFQVDTVAYHLSVLKPLFPEGINVLSLFTGIGGAEVALHRLQIPMKTVVSVEISPTNREILKDFWRQTEQKGVLIEYNDVEKFSQEDIECLMDEHGAFDLVIGGSPCNNFAGGNRVSRSGLEGAQSSLFFEYCRILEVVREKTATMRRRQ